MSCVKCGCNEKVGGAIYKGYCELCRQEYGMTQHKYNGREKPNPNHSDIDDHPEEMTDGEYFAHCGYTPYPERIEDEKGKVK